MKDYKEKRYGCALEKFHNLYSKGMTKCCPFIADCYHHLKYYSLAKEFFETFEFCTKEGEYPETIQNYFLFKLKLIDCYDNLQDFASLNNYVAKLNEKLQAGSTMGPLINKLTTYVNAILELRENNNVEEAIKLFNKCKDPITPAAKEYIKQIEEIKKKNEQIIENLKNELKKNKMEGTYCDLIDLYLLEKDLKNAKATVGEFEKFVLNENDKLSKFKVSFYKGKIGVLEVIELGVTEKTYEEIKGHLFSDFLKSINKDSIEKIKNMYIEAVDLLYKITAKYYDSNKKVFDYFIDWMKEKTFKMISKEHHYLIEAKIYYTQRNSGKALKKLSKYTTSSGKSGLEIEKMKNELEDLAKGFKNIGAEEEQQEESKEIKKEEDSDEEDI
jgi:hypothetical protein